VGLGVQQVLAHLILGEANAYGDTCGVGVAPMPVS
jgi:hypothetical protein